jgi:hypothetical protein
VYGGEGTDESLLVAEDDGLMGMLFADASPRWAMRFAQSRPLRLTL